MGTARAAVDKAKIVTSTTTHVVDHETGAIVSAEQTNVVRIPREPPYVKMYIEDLSHLMGLSAGAQAVLLELAGKVDFDGIVTIAKGTRERIAEKTGLTEPTVRNRVSDLVKAGVLKKGGYCEYELNPNLFAKGEWHEIHKRRQNFNLEFKIRYLDGKRELSANVV